MSDLTPNRPCKAGRMLGAYLAHVADSAWPDGPPKAYQPCRSCAYRKGTIPNGCLETVLDATKCAMEDHRFNCHQTDRLGEPCLGWQNAVLAIACDPNLKVPTTWPYGPFNEGEVEAAINNWALLPLMWKAVKLSPPNTEEAR